MNDNVGIAPEKNPDAIALPIEKKQESQGMLLNSSISQLTSRRDSVFFSFNKATPSGFAPWRQLPRLTIGALHCTGTVAGGIFRRISTISDPVLLLRRQDYKKTTTVRVEHYD
ncbi:hypothetical protein ACFS4T_07535 [Pseudomonas lini]